MRRRTSTGTVLKIMSAKAICCALSRGDRLDEMADERNAEDAFDVEKRHQNRRADEVERDLIEGNLFRDAGHLGRQEQHEDRRARIGAVDEHDRLRQPEEAGIWNAIITTMAATDDWTTTLRTAPIAKAKRGEPLVARIASRNQFASAIGATPVRMICSPKKRRAMPSTAPATTRVVRASP